MSHLSFVLTSPSFGTPAAQSAETYPAKTNGRRQSIGMARIQAAAAGRSFADAEDCTLPSGVASMQHWLDLNA